MSRLAMISFLISDVLKQYPKDACKSHWTGMSEWVLTIRRACHALFHTSWKGTDIFFFVGGCWTDVRSRYPAHEIGHWTGRTGWLTGSTLRTGELWKPLVVRTGFWTSIMILSPVFGAGLSQIRRFLTHRTSAAILVLKGTVNEYVY